uniref:Uncharacterized protein n=1 Tax=Arundo donax TaxID=35708 RepID=A0A0A9AT37_ARUDO
MYDITFSLSSRHEAVFGGKEKKKNIFSWFFPTELYGFWIHLSSSLNFAYEWNSGYLYQRDKSQMGKRCKGFVP